MKLNREYRLKRFLVSVENMNAVLQENVRNKPLQRVLFRLFDEIGDGSA